MRKRELLKDCVKIMLLCAAMFTVFCFVCSADGGTYEIRLPEQITVGQDEVISAYFYHPRELYPDCIQLSCSDASALKTLGGWCTMSDGTYQGTKSFKMLKKGRFTLTFSATGGFLYNVDVTVEDLAYPVLPHDSYIIQVGQTIPTGITLEGGVRYNGLRVSCDQPGIVSFNADCSEMTAIKHGFSNAKVYSGSTELGSFTVLAVDPCEGVQISTTFGRATVGLQTGLIISDSSGNYACSRLEITEGSEIASISYNQNSYASIIPNATGWVTVTAYGTDGSTDSVRLQVFDAPESMNVVVPFQTIAAGESMQLSVTFPEGCWAPAYFYLQSQEPEYTDISGTVALFSDDHVLTGVMAGTVRIYVRAGSLGENVYITVADSDAGLHINRPKNGFFDSRTSFQLCVTNGAGQAIPATFSGSGNGQDIRVSPEGLLTADGKHHMTVNVSVTDKIKYSFSVASVECPDWLEPEADVIVTPVNVSCEICEITANVHITTNDLKICSGDESIVSVEQTSLVPHKIGSTLITVWSRYCDVNCNVLVVVTEPTSQLYLDGTADNGWIFLAKNRTVNLPTLRDYNGKAVSVTWRVEYEDNPYGSSSGHCVSLLSGNRIKGLSNAGVAMLSGTAKNGAVFILQVSLYQPPTSCRFPNKEETFTVSDFRNQVVLEWSGGSSISDEDVTYTLTGDTNCVKYERSGTYCYFTCLREGTVTLTARLYNGKTAKTVIHSVLGTACKNGHDPIWAIADAPGPWWNGRRILQCSRCRVYMGREEVIPCTGKLSLADSSVFLVLNGATDSAWLGAMLDDDPKQSFVFTSSNPNVADVLGGIVFAVGEGEATITLSKGDCTPARCKVKVLTAGTFEFPPRTTKIEEGAFQGTAIIRTVIPNSVTRIESATFANCSMLVEVCIPDSVTFIADDAFADSQNVTIVCSPGSYAAAWADSHGVPRSE